jgi:hypothetical protein
MRRLIPRVLVVLGAAIVLLCLSIPIQQRVARSRAERLLFDIRSLELRKSTWDDAQRLFKRWGAWGRYEGTCTAADCRYQIELDDPLQEAIIGNPKRHPKIANWLWRRNWLWKFYIFLGGRWFRITAHISVVQGTVWGKAYRADVTARKAGPYTSFVKYVYEPRVIGRSASVTRFLINGPQFLDHPEYAITAAANCKPNCVVVDTSFTPYASPADIDRLMDFNLDCLTRYQPCRKSEILPAAWQQYVAETQRWKERSQQFSRCGYPLRLRARDAENAVVALVKANRMEKDYGAYQVSRMQLTERIKAARFWEENTEQDVRVPDPPFLRMSRNLPADALPGRRFILLFKRRKYAGPDGPSVWLDDCGCVPATDENLADVRAGADRDFDAKLERSTANSNWP